MNEVLAQTGYTAEKFCDHVIQKVSLWNGNPENDDDITLIVMDML